MTTKAVVPMSEADLQRAPRHRHEWWAAFEDDPVPVLAGVATGPDGRTVESAAEIVNFPRELVGIFVCRRCGKRRDETRSKRGRQSRNYGNRAELRAARMYGGEKVGHHGGPADIRGKEFATQVKTHRRLPPAEWRKAFAGLEQSSGVPRLLLRFVLGANGQGTEDYFVLPAKAWLDWFGRDE